MYSIGLVKHSLPPPKKPDDIQLHLGGHVQVCGPVQVWQRVCVHDIAMMSYTPENVRNDLRRNCWSLREAIKCPDLFWVDIDVTVFTTLSIDADQV